jgi:shikimate dehydrogenase
VKLALIGDPVAHSGSPQLHGDFLAEAGIEGTYEAVKVPAGGGAAAVRRLRAEGYTGLNVTYPLKEEVLAACDELTEEADRAQAVNTIFFGRSTIGHNTDGIGARSALEQVLARPVALERIGILGTGSTARAILEQLRETDAYTFVWGRDARKVSEICERLEARRWPPRPPEIAISTLPPDADLPEEIVTALRVADCVMDTNYGLRSSLEERLKREVVRGDLMLEAQARASFDFWLAHAQTEVEGL